MVQTRKQRERQAASIADGAYGLALLAFAYGWLGHHSLVVGFSMGFAVLMLTAGGLYLLRRRRDARLRRAGLDDLNHMNGEQFEALLQASFRDKGYRVSLTPNGADYGADLLLERDGTKTAVQAKHWRTRKVGVRAVQEIAAAKAHYRAGKAAVIASGDFTDQAVRLAASNGIEFVGPCPAGPGTPERREPGCGPLCITDRSQPTAGACDDCFGHLAPLRTGHGTPHWTPRALLGMLGVPRLPGHMSFIPTLPTVPD